MIGLGVMGRNLALNLADHGFRVAGYDRDDEAVHRFAEAERAIRKDSPRVVGCHDVKSFVKALKSPRVIIVLVPAGRIVDMVCDDLLAAGLHKDDIVVDAGNSLWSDTVEREAKYRGKLMFFGSGVSGGEVGARFGPSLMPGGDREAWKRLEPMWTAIAAKVDAKTGRPLEGARAGKPVTGGEACAAYIGPDGAGHYVKMVHNGIEYADMQLICEAYHVMRAGLGLPPALIGETFEEWNNGELESYLIEITADILHQADPVTDRPIVEMILDKAGQKGTGKWTAVNALDLGIPAATIAEAVFARGMSALKDERIKASESLGGPKPSTLRTSVDDAEAFVNHVRDALYCSKICVYAQGFQLMRAMSTERNWNIDFGTLAKIWRGGCIIRAAFLQPITEAFRRSPALPNLLMDSFFMNAVAEKQKAWRTVIAAAANAGIPTPAFSSALAYYDSYRSAVLPANLLQAQRDYFGAHTYERVDQPRGEMFHLDWPSPERTQEKR